MRSLGIDDTVKRPRVLANIEGHKEKRQPYLDRTLDLLRTS